MVLKERHLFVDIRAPEVDENVMGFIVAYFEAIRPIHVNVEFDDEAVFVVGIA